jgi:hypothetical protein
MNCHAFRKGMRQIAASGRDPTGIAREHLDSCPFCKEAFTRERFIFGSIDAALRAAVKYEIPAQSRTF